MITLNISVYRRKFLIFALVVTLCLFCFNLFPSSLARPNMTAFSPRLQLIFTQTKTICFGRFVVDVPRTADVVFGPSHIDWPIEFYRGEASKIEEYVARGLLEVEKDRIYLDPDSEIAREDSLFGKVVEGASPGQKLVFGSRDHNLYSIQSFIPLGEDLFVQRAGSALSKDAEVAVLNTVSRNLRHRGEDEVPVESGACIEGGFVTWQPEFERATIGIRLKEFPDVHFSVEAKKNQAYVSVLSALEPRLQRAEKIGGGWYSGVKFFRRGPRQIGDWKGYEALARKPAQAEETESHEFAFVSLGAPHDPLQPEFDIKLDTGVKDNQKASTKPSLTDEEAVAVWDKLTSSLRVRVSKSTTPATADVPKVPLGALVRTGSECPQSGWWYCAHERETTGGARRHFLAGDVMPHAVISEKSSLWQKLSGGRPTAERDVVWKLLAYEAEGPSKDQQGLDDASR